MSDDEHEGQRGRTLFTGLLFGNVDKKGNLEGGVIGEEEAGQLSALDIGFGGGLDLQSFAGVPIGGTADDAVDDRPVMANKDAIDFEDEDSLIDEEDETNQEEVQKDGKQDGTAGVDEDASAEDDLADELVSEFQAEGKDDGGLEAAMAQDESANEGDGEGGEDSGGDVDAGSDAMLGVGGEGDEWAELEGALEDEEEEEEGASPQAAVQSDRVVAEAEDVIDIDVTSIQLPSLGLDGEDMVLKFSELFPPNSFIARDQLLPKAAQARQHAQQVQRTSSARKTAVQQKEVAGEQPVSEVYDESILLHDESVILHGVAVEELLDLSEESGSSESEEEDGAVEDKERPERPARQSSMRDVRRKGITQQRPKSPAPPLLITLDLLPVLFSLHLPPWHVCGQTAQHHMSTHWERDIMWHSQPKKGSMQKPHPVGKEKKKKIKLSFKGKGLANTGKTPDKTAAKVQSPDKGGGSRKASEVLPQASQLLSPVDAAAPAAAPPVDDSMVWEEIITSPAPPAQPPTPTHKQTQPEHTTGTAAPGSGDHGLCEPLPQPSGRLRDGSWIHPEVLRLEQLDLSVEGIDSQVDKLLLRRYNDELAAADWLDGIQWTLPGTSASAAPPVLLNLNDEQQFFEGSPSRPEAACLEQAAATVLPPPAKLKLVCAPYAHNEGEAAHELAIFNISKDHHYSSGTKKSGEKGGAVSKHSVLAQSLAALPLRLSPQELADFHRPRALWLPPLNEPAVRIKRSGSASIQMKVCSLGGIVETFKDLRPESFSRDTLKDMWTTAVSGKKFSGAKEDPPPVFCLTTRPLAPLDHSLTLEQAGISPNDMKITLYAIFQAIKLLPTGIVGCVPNPTVPLRPPAAFQKRKELSVISNGHVVVLEYLEERPMLLGQTGMGVRLTTYYRKQTATDDGFHKLKGEGERWRVGHVTPLNPHDDSPFLGNVRPGEAQMAVDATMFKSLAVPYNSQASDFLLVRTSTGTMRLRELTGSIAVGQQEPNMRVPMPQSKDLREYEERRMVTYVFRELRSRQSKQEKKGDTGPVCISIKELAQLFPHEKENTIRLRLREKCELVPNRGDEGSYCLKEGATIPSETELRKSLTPDSVCCAESMAAVVDRLAAAGIKDPDRFLGIPPDKLKLAIEMLPEDTDVRQAATFLELCVKMTPWNLTDSYMSAIREGKGQLALIGQGDPSGRGYGYSFLKDVRKAEKAGGDAAAKREAGSITGTNADLRRLSMERAREVLLQFGLSEEEIATLTRWNRIALVRTLSSAAAADGAIGSGDVSVMFARGQRMSAAQQQQVYQERCQAIFDKQAAVLAGESPESTVVPDEEEQAAEEPAEEKTTKQKGKKGGGRKKKVKDEDEEAALREFRETVLEQKDNAAASKKKAEEKGEDAEEPQQAATGKAAADAKLGERRVRRTITYTMPDGQQVVREIIFTDRDKVALLNSLYGREGKEGGAGFGRRVVKGGRGVIATQQNNAKFVGRAGGRGGTLKPVGGRHAADKFRRNKDTSVKCSACGAVGHTKANKKLCPLWHNSHNEDEQEAMETEFDPVMAELEAEFGDILEEDLELDKDTTTPGKPDKSPMKLTIKTTAAAAKKRKMGAEGDLGSPPAKSRKSFGGVLDSGEYDRRPSKSVKKKDSSARKQLHKKLQGVLKAVRKDKLFDVFTGAVVKSTITDYNVFVKVEEEMYFDKIHKKLNQFKYSSVADFRADFNQIRINAERYNTEGAGKFAYPNIIPSACQLVARVDEELAKMADELAEAEARMIGAAGAGGMAGGEGEEGKAPAADEKWVQCTKCNKWRNISYAVYEQTLDENDQNAAWHCDMNFERVNASCEDMDDWEFAEQAGLV